MCIYPGQQKGKQNIAAPVAPKKRVLTDIVNGNRLATLPHDSHCEPQQTSSTAYRQGLLTTMDWQRCLSIDVVNDDILATLYFDSYCQGTTYFRQRAQYGFALTTKSQGCSQMDIVLNKACRESNRDRYFLNNRPKRLPIDGYCRQQYPRNCIHQQPSSPTIDCWV